MLKATVLALCIGLLGLADVAARSAEASGSPTSAQAAILAGSVRGLAATTLSGPADGEGEAESNHETLFKIINFVILVGALGYVLRKPLAAFFAQRSDSIRKSLDEGRKALEASQAQLAVIEQKLGGLEEEIARFKADSAREMEAERERLRQTAAAEAERMLAFARAQIESAARAAQLELKAHAARQAVDLAEQTIRQRLDEAGRRQLVERFVRELGQQPN